MVSVLLELSVVAVVSDGALSAVVDDVIVVAAVDCVTDNVDDIVSEVSDVLVIAEVCDPDEVTAVDADEIKGVTGKYDNRNSLDNASKSSKKPQIKNERKGRPGIS